MKTVAFKDIPAADWDELVDGSDDAWLMHRAGWIDIETSFFVRDNLSFGLYDREQLIALQPLYLSDGGTGTAHGERLVHCGVHRHTGLALSGELSRTDARAARSHAMNRILHLASAHGADRIQLNSHNLNPRNRTAQRDDIPFWVVENGFQLGLGFGPNGLDPAPGFGVTNADQVVDLTEPVEVLFAGLDEACRRAVRKAEKAQLLFVADKSAERLERYFALAKASSLRTGEALPPYDYYKAILERFGAEGHVAIVFARQGDRDVAALMLLIAKGAANFLAGVSDPTSLSLRPNDFIHWHAMLAAKDMGLDVYRFGPVFPEVPSDWPIAKVSSFKGKFGARSIPIIQGSLFLNPERAEAASLAAAKHMAVLSRPRTKAKPPAPSLAADTVAHHLRLFGFGGASSDPDIADLLVADAAGEGGWIAARQAAERGTPVVLLRPSRAADYLDGVSFEPGRDAPGSEFTAAVCPEDAAWRRLRSLYPSETIHVSPSVPVVNVPGGGASWVWLPFGRSGMLLIGTDLHRDLTRFRQGDPAAADNRPTDAQWGFAGERPTYLFAGQLEDDRPHDRMADWWMWAMRDALVRHAGMEAMDILPSGARGMVIVTGDDDQAPLEDYRAQRELLGDLPVTYFLHPLCQLGQAGLAEVSSRAEIEWELHPDALETPNEYDARFSEQARWFETLTGRGPRLVRNHGFLNDGYWGHASAWSSHGIVGSSNLPGLDCRVLNGSLLPARLALDGRLTDHWSLLTAFGDGVMFALEWDEGTANHAIMEAGRRIVESGVPGILVFNLHPANHAKAACMHESVRRLVTEQGFIAMTFGSALEWFSARDGSLSPTSGRVNNKPATSDDVFEA